MKLNLKNKKENEKDKLVLRKGYYSSEGYVPCISSNTISSETRRLFINFRGILSIMNRFFKIATGILGGLAIIMSLGGFKKNSEKRNNTTNNVSTDELPDDILDGNNIIPNKRKGDRIRQETEENVRSLQESLTRASNILGHVSIICNSFVKMFCEDPCVRVTPTTYIF